MLDYIGLEAVACALTICCGPDFHPLNTTVMPLSSEELVLNYTKVCGGEGNWSLCLLWFPGTVWESDIFH